MRKHKRMLYVWLLLSGLLFTTGASGLMAANTPQAANRMKPDQAPTPFSAAQIRDACTRGRKIVFQMEIFGKPMFFQTITFSDWTEEGTFFETATKGTDGKVIGKRQWVQAKWSDLQEHAAFPAKETVIDTAEITVPAGTFKCWLYTVTTESEGKKITKRLWFAKDLPGPPVSMEESTDGVITLKMIMLKTGK